MKGIMLLLLLLNIALLTNARENSGSVEKSLLWRISGKDMEKPSYLFGTMHLICPEDYLWTDAMQKCLTNAEALCFEMDLDDPALIMEVTEGMIDLSGKKLSDYFTESDYAKLERYIYDSLGMDLSIFQQLKPAALQTLIGSEMLACDSPVSYETKLMEIGQSQGKDILGLEKASEQLDLFENLPADSVVKEVMDFVNNGPSNNNEYTALSTAFKNQDLQALHNLIQKSNIKDVDLAGFIDVRNEKWIKRMEEKMEQQSVFFAVGAGHLWGQYGIITLLRKAGYKVQPIK